MIPEEYKSIIRLPDENKDKMSIPIVVLRNDDEKVNWKVKELDELICERGFHISIVADGNQTLKTGKRYTLNLVVDWGIIGRGAGRKAKATNVTLAEIREMEKQGMHSKEISEKTGLSIATYFRRKALAINKEQEGMDAAEITI